MDLTRRREDEICIISHSLTANRGATIFWLWKKNFHHSDERRISVKTVCLLGSPRMKGNSAALAEQFCETVKSLGGTVDTFALNKLSYRGCQGCMMCKTKLERCALKDDLEGVLDSIRDADILVMATPTYYGEVSSQMKGFIDRTFSYLKPDYRSNPIPSRLKGGKKLVFIQAQAQPDENQFADVFPRYEYFFKWYGFDDIRSVRACGVMAPGEASERKDVMDLATQTARELMAGRAQKTESR